MDIKRRLEKRIQIIGNNDNKLKLIKDFITKINSGVNNNKNKQEISLEN